MVAFIGQQRIGAPNPLLDIAPLADALGQYRQGMDRQHQAGVQKQQMQAEEQQRTIDNAFRSSQVEQQKAEFGANQQHRQAQLGIQQEQAQRQKDEIARKQLGGIMQMIDSEQDPVRKQQMWDAYKTRQQGILKHVDDDPVRGPQAILAQVRGYVDPAKSSGDTDDIREYDLARKTGFGGSFLEYMQAKRSRSAPETTMDKEISKARVNRAEKNIASAQGAQDMSRVVAELQSVASDPGLSAAIGPIGQSSTYQTVVGALPFSQTLGMANPTLNARIVRLQSQLELAGGEKMKGLGAQSDADSARLQRAVSNLSSARNGQEFMEAIEVINNSIQGSLARGQQAANEFPDLAGPLNAQPQSQGGLSPGSYVFDPATGQLVPK